MSASSSGGIASLIAEQAEAHEASVLGGSGGDLSVAVHLRRSSGRVIPFNLVIETLGRAPRVREARPLRLPRFCPDRHIGIGGYFCLGFTPEESLAVTDEASARAWWARLLKFLHLQVTAAVLRRWPSRHEWGHGDAAFHQAEAERRAASLGPRFSQALARRRLEVRHRRRAAAFLELWDGGRKLYSVWARERRVATLRQACVCGSGRPLAACGAHAAAAAELPFDLLAWEREERAFWREAKDQPCCGSLLTCPLATRGGAANDLEAVRAA